MGRGQFLHHPAHHPCEVSLAQVRRQHPHAHRLALPKRAREIVRPIVQPRRRFLDPIPGLLGDGLGRGELFNTSETVVCESSRCSAAFLGSRAQVALKAFPLHVGVVTRPLFNREQRFSRDISIFHGIGCHPERSAAQSKDPRLLLSSHEWARGGPGLNFETGDTTNPAFQIMTLLRLDRIRPGMQRPTLALQHKLPAQLARQRHRPVNPEPFLWKSTWMGPSG